MNATTTSGPIALAPIITAPAPIMAEAREAGIAGASFAGVLAGRFLIFAVLFLLWRV
jgi:hypothetical protein